MRKILFIALLSSSPSFALVHYKVDSIGQSAKGQFIALEEYGYRPDKRTHFVEIKILNLWKKKFVGDVIRVEKSGKRNLDLSKSRTQAKKLAENQLKTYGILTKVAEESRY